MSAGRSGHSAGCSTLKKLGKFEIIGEVGRGAMGVVYEGRDPFIGRKVAIKTISTGLSENKDLLERFLREAQAAGSLQHPNIVTIFDAGEEAGTQYIAMEFLEGEDLAHMVAGEMAGNPPLPAAVKMGYIVKVCQALDYAHRNNIVHRDIKPGNIFIKTDGTVKVVDFGIARLTNTSSTSSGVLIGTIDYMSPEQIRGEKVDGRSDIWAVGVMTFEILTHQKPFQGSNITAVMFSIVSQEPKALRELRPDLPPELEKVLKRMFRKDANERYQTMDELLSDLEPVWRRMQQDDLGSLVNEAEALFKSGNFVRARDLLEKARLIDSSHSHAKTLLDKISVEIRKSQVLPKLKEMVASGQKLMQAGKFDEARVEIENALRIDSAFQPARDLLSAVQKAAERNQNVQAGLRTTRQRMAEGSLTEAEQSVAQVLELAPDNPEAQSLRRQIQEEKDRRNKRKRISDAMQHARQLWTAQQFEEADTLLSGLLKEFPGESEVAKLLETVRADSAQQEVQRALTKARKHLGSQEFSESLSTLDEVLQRYPQETAAQKLRDLVLQERKEHANRLRLQRELQGLKRLVSEEKYQDAITLGEGLLKEFPDEFELARMVDYARSQKSQQQLQLRKQARIKELQELIQASSFDKAIAACEEALKEFAGDAEFLRLLELSRSQQKEQKDRERSQLIEQRLRNIKQSIERGELTDAIDLGKRTLMQVGADTDVTKLVEMAEQERTSRDEKRALNQQVQTAITMLESKKFSEATQVLRKAEESGVFDPRVDFLKKAAEEQRPLTREDLTLILNRPVAPAAPPREATPEGAGASGSRGQTTVQDVDQTVDVRPGPPSAGSPVSDATRVFAPGGVEETAQFAAPSAPQTPPAAPASFNATSVMPVGPAEKNVTKIAPAPAEAPRLKEKKGKKGKKGERWRPQTWRGEEFIPEPESPKPEPPAPAPVQASATAFMPAANVEEAVQQPPSSATSIGQAAVIPPPPKPRLEELPAPEAPRERRKEPRPEPVPHAEEPAAVVSPTLPFWRSGMGMTLGGLALAAVVGIGIYKMMGTSPATGPAANNTTTAATTNSDNSSPGGGTATPEVNPGGGATPTPTGPSSADEANNFIKLAKKLMTKDTSGARADLDKAEKIVKAENLGASYQRRIDDTRATITKMEGNAALQALLAKEAELWDAAEKALAANQFDQAAATYNQILGLGEGGVHKTDAQTELNRIPTYKQEESLFQQAQAAAQKRGSVADVDAAVQKLNEVANLHGRREPAARQLLGELAPVRAQLQAAETAAAKSASDAAERATRIKQLQSEARAAINNKDVAGAQQKVAALQREGENVSGLNDEIIKLADSLRIRATCQVGQVTHDDHAPLFKKGDTMAQIYLDKPVALTAASNCGLSTELTQNLAKGTKIQIVVDLDENGTVIGGRVPGGNSVGTQILAIAPKIWKFNPPTVHGTPVKTTVGVQLLIS